MTICCISSAHRRERKKFPYSYSPSVIERIATSQRLGDAAVRRHIARDPYISADGRTASDRDSAQDRRTGIDDDIIFDNRMSRVALDQRAGVTDRKPLGAQRHRLVQPHALAHSCGLANDDAGSVIDEKTCIDFRARMNVDAGGRMRQLGDDAREQRDVEKIKLMRETMMRDAR